MRTVAVSKLGRAVGEGFVGILLEQLLVDHDGIVRGKLSTVHILDLAFLHHFLGGSKIAGIDGGMQFILGERTRRKNGCRSKGQYLTHIFHTVLSIVLN